MDFNALYASFNARDMESVLAQLHPSVRWPNAWEGGILTGREAVRDYWTRQWQVIDPIVTPLGIDPLPDGRIRVTVRQAVDGQVSQVSHVYTIRDGLVTEMEIAP